jgi:hypothetical protein
VTRFEHWTNPGVSGIAVLRVAPRWLVLLFVLALVSFSVAFALPQGLVAGGFLAAGMVVLYLVLLRTWLVAIARLRLALVEVNGLSDYARVGVFFISAALGGIAVFLAWLGTILFFAAMQDFVQPASTTWIIHSAPSLRAARRGRRVEKNGVRSRTSRAEKPGRNAKDPSEHQAS